MNHNMIVLSSNNTFGVVDHTVTKVLFTYRLSQPSIDLMFNEDWDDSERQLEMLEKIVFNELRILLSKKNRKHAEQLGKVSMYIYANGKKTWVFVSPTVATRDGKFSVDQLGKWVELG